MLVLSLVCLNGATHLAYGQTTESTRSITVHHTLMVNGTDDTSYVQMPNAQFTRGGKWDTQDYCTVLPQNKKQNMIGIGSSITETSAWVVHQLPEDKQEFIFNKFFGDSEAALSLTRTHIGSCDFSTHLYDYAPDKGNPDDKNVDLPNFSIEEDMVDLVPALKKALSIAPDLKIFSAPWAPPAWMKVSGDRQGKAVINGGSITTKPNHMDPQYYPHYSNYIIKYLQAYTELDIPIYSLSMQNETQNNASWESCYWSSDQSIDFIQNHLGPKMEAAGFSNIKLLIWDWDRQEGAFGKGDGFLTYNRNVLNSGAGNYVDGVAFHWYGATKFFPPPEVDNYNNIATLKSEYPTRLFVGTEACIGLADAHKNIGEYYAHDMINDIRAGSNGWIDWNFVLDQDGGPLHTVDNNCTAPMVVNTTTKDITITDEYYVLKHFSRTIRPGDTAITSNYGSGDYRNRDQVNQTAFLDSQTGNVKLIVANGSGNNANFVIQEGGEYAPVTIPAHTVATYEFTPGTTVDYEVARNKPTTSSSFEGNPIHNYKAEMATDNNNGTRWASAWTDSEWVQVDLGSTMTIQGVDLLWSWGWKNIYDIQVSEDGEQWNTVVQIDGEANLSSNAKEPCPVHISFQEPVTGRYVRMIGRTNRMGYGYSLYNFSVQGN